MLKYVKQKRKQNTKNKSKRAKCGVLNLNENNYDIVIVARNDNNNNITATHTHTLRISIIIIVLFAVLCGRIFHWRQHRVLSQGEDTTRTCVLMLMHTSIQWPHGKRLAFVVEVALPWLDQIVFIFSCF